MSYRRLKLTNFRGFKLDPAFTAFSHETVAVTVVSMAVWTLDHLKYTYLEG